MAADREDKELRLAASSRLWPARGAPSSSLAPSSVPCAGLARLGLRPPVSPFAPLRLLVRPPPRDSPAPAPAFGSPRFAHDRVLLGRARAQLGRSVVSSPFYYFVFLMILVLGLIHSPIPLILVAQRVDKEGPRDRHPLPLLGAGRSSPAEMASMAAAMAGSQCYYTRTSWALRQRGIARALTLPPRRSFSLSAAAGFDNQNREYVIVGGGNAAGYAARTFVEHGMADGRLCIVSKEAFPPYERPALTKGYLFPPDKKPARLPGFHTCVGSGGQRQTAEWYKENGIEVLYEDPVVAFDGKTQTLKTTSGKILKYGSLIISTGCEASRLPEKIGGNLPGVHYIRDVADADSLVSSLGRAKKVVVIGGGYIGMEVAAAACGWNLDTTIIFPEDHIMPRLFTPSLAKKYEELYQQNGVKFIKGALIDKLEAGSDGRVSSAVLKDGSVVEADTVIVGIGAKPVISPFEAVGVNIKVGGIEVDSLFRTSVPGIFAIGDVAAFPLKMYNRIARVEHVDHARKSAHHCVETLLTSQTKPYDYLPYFYSRVFEYEGSSRKVWWQFYGDNVGETVEVGNFDPKIATFWIDSESRLKGVFLESGTSEEFSLLPQLARSQPLVDKAKLKSATSVEDALEIARSSLQSISSV